MYILARDKKTLLEFGRIRVFKTGKKFILEAWGRSGSPSPLYLAEYETEQEAILEMERIYAALAASQNVYEVK